MRTLFKTILPCALLVFALLFAQQGAMSHGLSHTLVQQDHSAPHDTQCELCAAYAPIGNAVGSSDIHFDFDVTPIAGDVSLTAIHLPPAFVAFSARAPPYSA